MPGPLEGVTILDLTWVLSGPYASMVMCDLGAEVIKLERPPRGDVARTTLPIKNGESGYFFSINRGKKSMSIDLTKDEGKELFLRLVEKVDVVMENFTPGSMDKLGLGYETLRQRNPRLIYAATSGFGAWALGAVLLGAGTAMVYPILLAAIGDVAHPTWRASSVGIYRFWRDAGFAIGAILAGVVADVLGLPAAVWAVAALTVISGLVVAIRMYETLLKPSRAVEEVPS